MKKKSLLFVTCLASPFEEGLSYVLDLARTMEKNLSVLILQRNNTVSEKLKLLEKKRKSEGINIHISVSVEAAFIAISSFFMHEENIEMIILGPSLSKTELSLKEINKLARVLTVPLMTVSAIKTGNLPE